MSRTERFLAIEKAVKLARSGRIDDAIKVMGAEWEKYSDNTPALLSALDDELWDCVG